MSCETSTSGGPDFVYPPPAAAGAAGGHGRPVRLDRLAPAVLAGYPLIISRRDPLASRPPAAYRLVWQGSYYEVWQRAPGAPAAVRHVALRGDAARQCARLGRLAASPQAAGVPALAVARAPDGRAGASAAQPPARAAGAQGGGTRAGLRGTSAQHHLDP